MGRIFMINLKIQLCIFFLIYIKLNIFAFHDIIENVINSMWRSPKVDVKNLQMNIDCAWTMSLASSRERELIKYEGKKFLRMKNREKNIPKICYTAHEIQLRGRRRKEKKKILN